MTNSMTSFARTDFENADICGSWEIKSVNHRFCDIAIRVPEDLRTVESKARESISIIVKRGKIDCTLRVSPITKGTETTNINENAAKSLLSAMEWVCTLMTTPSRNVSPLEILAWPGVVNELEPLTNSIVSYLLTNFELTLEQFAISRANEGQKLESIIKKQLTKMAAQVSYLEERIPDIISSMTKRHKARLSELDKELDHGRVEQESAILISKLDIKEEVDRLFIHIQETNSVFDRQEPIGRRLDFLMQELNREANTIGSKSVHVDTTSASIELKVLIEQVREQVQNVE
ncbi:MAG: YicC family protein [Proteobacteria bacterium]|mgnify:FL=1|nr:YicC family protein [Pseudomonadota bacterium]MBT5066361.1 YicC family protein [Pseudomonadota bacterium]MBT6192030.1 YicC family protein [Pseudomonadota bacterium]MBT6464505.1 YicC family protein [Pseudomonadota bacterium]MBT6674519.1 YicC family protein [Pseudomonadota bacterium]